MCKCTKYTLSLFSNCQESNTFHYAIGCTSDAYALAKILPIMVASAAGSHHLTPLDVAGNGDDDIEGVERGLEGDVLIEI